MNGHMPNRNNYVGFVKSLALYEIWIISVYWFLSVQYVAV